MITIHMEIFVSVTTPPTKMRITKPTAMIIISRMGMYLSFRLYAAFNRM
jgi:hypothetical protein